VANSTTIIADLKTVISNNITNGVNATTQANANNPTAVSATGGATNLTGGTGVYGSGTYYGGEMDYLGMLNLALLKAQEMAVIMARITVNTSYANDATNQGLLVNILNDFQ
jgi:hypothetical protein